MKNITFHPLINTSNYTVKIRKIYFLQAKFGNQGTHDKEGDVCPPIGFKGT